MITEKDLDIINEALLNGMDVRIQCTSTGCRIVADRIKVLKRIKTEENASAQEGAEKD